MTWVKRNLYFVIGSAVTVALLGVVGWLLFSKWQLNNEILEKLNGDFAELKRLAQQNPHPGWGPVDNIKTAKEQRKTLRDFIQTTRPYFERIAPIPDVPRVTDHDFSGALSRTLDELQRAASGSSVIIASNYSFSFEAQRNLVSFTPGSLRPLSIQLGEVKEICGALFGAKINNLSGIRREAVSADDAKVAQTDYLPERSVTNDLAVLTPYEVTFDCFSSELANVLSRLGSSKHGLVVKTINVEPAPAAAGASTGEPTPGMAGPFTPQPVGPSPEQVAAMMQAQYSRRMGGRPGMGVPGVPGVPGAPGGYTPGFSPPPATPTPYTPPAAVGGAPAPSRSSQPALDEKPLKITMTVVVVKLQPSK
jgi:hypothetical protein